MTKGKLFFHGAVASVLALAPGALAQTIPLRVTRMVPSNGVMHLSWTNGPVGPYIVQQRQGVHAAWVDVGAQTMGTSAAVPMSGSGPCFFRVKGFTSDLTAPAIPANFKVTNCSCAAVTLTWQPSPDLGGSGLRGYRVYRDGVYRALVNAPATALVDTGLVASTTYTYHVCAVDYANNESRSTSSNRVTTASCSPSSVCPLIPTGLRITSTSCNAVGLAWSAAVNNDGSAVLGYDIQRDGRWAGRVLTPVTSWIDTSNVTGSSNYWYSVLAVNSASSYSPACPPVPVSTPKCPETTPPSVPGNVMARATSCSNVLLNWSASTDTGGSGLLGYLVYRGGRYHKFVPAFATSTTDSGLAVATTYTYAVVAIDGDRNTSAVSIASSLITPACNLPPLARIACPTHAAVGSNIVFNASASSDPDGTITSYQWNFGDGAVGSGVTSAHAYGSAGTYAVTLTVTDNAGASATTNVTVTITSGSYVPQLTALVPAVNLAYAVASQGHYAYVANSGFGLSVVDMSVPAAPRPVAASLLPFDGRKIAVSGSNVCVTGERNFHRTPGTRSIVSGFYAFGTTGGTNPVLRARVENASLQMNGVAVSKDFAYVACGGSGVKAYDLGRPWETNFLEGGYTTAGWCWGVTVADNYLYLAEGSLGLRILNVSSPGVLAPVNPANPTDGFLPLANGARAVTVVGNTAYVVNGNVLQMVDVTNKRAPALLGTLLFSANVNAADLQVQYEVALGKTIAYLAGGGGGLLVVDVSDPARATTLGILTPSGGPNVSTIGVTVSGSFAYLANYDGGLAVASVGTGAMPMLVTRLNRWFEGHRVAIAGSRAVVAGVEFADGGWASASGVAILDLSDPTRPSVLGKILKADLQFNGVAIGGDFAYLACGGAGVKVYDLRNPRETNFLAGGYATAGWCRGVAVVSNNLYVAEGSQGLRILDLGTPGSPALVNPGNQTEGWLALANGAWAVTVLGNVAYVLNGNALQMVDVTNKRAPALLGTFSASVNVTGKDLQVRYEAALGKTVAYLAGGGGGLLVVDVSDPRRPALLGSLAPRGGPNASTSGVTLSGPFAYLANFDGGIAVVDITQPATPRLTQSLLLPGYSRSIALLGTKVWVGNSSSTLDGVTIAP